jgi:hypothetical protein
VPKPSQSIKFIHPDFKFVYHVYAFKSSRWKERTDEVHYANWREVYRNQLSHFGKLVCIGCGFPPKSHFLHLNSKLCALYIIFYHLNKINAMVESIMHLTKLSKPS